MGKKTESRLINEIEVTASETLTDIKLKKKIIEKNIMFLKRYHYTKSWWYEYELPIIMKRLEIEKFES